jgi:hypothetical protein
MAVSFFSAPFNRYEIIGMAGNQVLEWTDLDTAIKTAGLKNVRGSYNDICGCYSDKGETGSLGSA